MCKLCDTVSPTATPGLSKPLVRDQDTPVLKAVPDLPQKGTKDFRKHRAKLWELETELHCSVIGTCAPVSELRRIHEKINKAASNQYSDYQIHNLFVTSAEHPHAGIKLLHRYLEKTHAVQIARARGLKEEDELLSLWRKCVDDGTVAGGYWAIMTHPHLTQGAYMRVFGEVHMLSHVASRHWQADRAKTRTLKGRFSETRQSLDDSRNDVERLQKSLGKSNIALQELESRTAFQTNYIAELENKLAAFGSNEIFSTTRDRIDQLSQQLEKSERDHSESLKTLVQQQTEEREIAHQSIDELEKGARLLEHRLEVLLDEQGAKTCRKECDLYGRCVLYVGGQTASQPNFRHLVEQLNGKFLHHDGGREDSRQSLAGLINQADAVVCPTTCVSHAAMHKIKQVCERKSKKMIWLRSSSLTAFNSALNEVSG